MARRPSSMPSDWVWKTLAGVLLGPSLALVSSALLAMAIERIPGTSPSVAAQLTMWSVPPVWMAVLSGAFAFQTGARAWLWLGLANVALVGVLLLVQSL